MEVAVVYLTFQKLCLKIEVLTIDMPEDGDVLRTALDGECDRKRIAVSSSKEAILGNEVKGCAFLQILIQG